VGRLAEGYGSEWQLRTYLDSDPATLNESVHAATGGHVEEWLRRDAREWKGLDFLPSDSSARQAWPKFWPQSGNVQNWDAVGRLRVKQESRWLLVEAKAHLGEIETRCVARNSESRRMISSALESTKAAIGVPRSADWLSTYYQYANRLAVLHFLDVHGVAAHLLFVYFLGDRNPGANCPERPEDWETALKTMYAHLGLSGTSTVEARTHSVFLPAKVLAKL
jgi:hypothetical protein